MKTIGLIGGMSWESTLLYYQQVNEGIKNNSVAYIQQKSLFIVLTLLKLNNTNQRGNGI